MFPYRAGLARYCPQRLGAQSLLPLLLLFILPPLPL
jgi:hypothetical protein